jgi:peptide deformylase
MGRKSRVKAEARSQGATRKVSRPACLSRRDSKVCEPLNKIIILGDSPAKIARYASCQCGRQFPLSNVVFNRLLSYASEEFRLSRSLDAKSAGGVVAGVLDLQLKGAWPRDQVSNFSKTGVVPVGTPVLHSPTMKVPILTEGVAEFASHMQSVMEQARGIGLAANQVGEPLRVLTHKFPEIAPPIFINPQILETDGSWEYSEGCLSLKLEGTNATLRRPKVVVVRAVGIQGEVIVVEADELFARVLQHEIDHLDGIEYVQRLDEEERERVYKIIGEHGIDLSCIPLLT